MEEVYIVFGSAKDELKPLGEEIAEAEAEGIKILYLVAIKEIVVQNGKLSGIRMDNQIPGVRDAQGRRRHDEIDGAEFVISCDTLITAVSRKPDLQAGSHISAENGGMVLSNPVTCETNMDGVFAGCDVSDAATVIQAIAAGKRAACAIDRYIAGDKAVLENEDKYPVASREAVLKRTGYFKDKGKVDINTANGKDRTHGRSIPRNALRAVCALTAVLTGISRSSIKKSL